MNDQPPEKHHLPKLSLDEYIDILTVDELPDSELVNLTRLMLSFNFQLGDKVVAHNKPYQRISFSMLNELMGDESISKSSAEVVTALLAGSQSYASKLSNRKLLKNRFISHLKNELGDSSETLKYFETL